MGSGGLTKGIMTGQVLDHGLLVDYFMLDGVKRRKEAEMGQIFTSESSNKNQLLQILKVRSKFHRSIKPLTHFYSEMKYLNCTNSD